jgi:hypothetical protein
VCVCVCARARACVRVHIEGCLFLGLASWPHLPSPSVNWQELLESNSLEVLIVGFVGMEQEARMKSKPIVNTKFSWVFNREIPLVQM